MSDPEEGLTMDTMAGGGRYRLGSIMEDAPVTWDGRTVGRIKDGLVFITDDAALRLLRDHQPLEVSINPIDPPWQLLDWPRP